MLSESLKGLIAQNLCRKIGGGRIAALEILLINSAISNLIREAKTFQIPSMMQVGRAQGMVALNEADLKAVDKAGFEGLLKRAGLDTKFVQGAAGWLDGPRLGQVSDEAVLQSDVLPVRPRRPEAQDVALSRLKHGFESRRGRHIVGNSTTPDSNRSSAVVAGGWRRFVTLIQPN